MGELLDYLVDNEEGFRKARLPALYSDFRGLRTINPDGYQANVSAWRRGLARLVRAGLAPSGASTPSSLVLNADESLLRALESKQYGRPLALGVVVREAAAERDLIPLQDFLAARESIYHRSWASLPWDAVWWGLRQLGVTGALAGRDDRLPNARFVVLANVEAAAQALADRMAGRSSRFERTFSRPHFEATFAPALGALSGTDVAVLLKFMSRDKGLLAYDGKTVRIRAAGAPDEAADITAEDEAVASLRELTDYLRHQTALLGARVDELAAAAKDAVARGNRVAALAALRSRKAAEASLGRRFATLGQLEDVAARIEQAADSVQLVRAMDAGASALAGLNARAGGAERVDEVVGRLREQMAQADEVGSILAEAGAAPAPDDEAEVDDELAAMEREERAREEAAGRAAREARAEREAEETARRLAALGPVGPITEGSTAGAAAAGEGREAERQAERATEELGRMSLEEKPRAQLAS